MVKKRIFVPENFNSDNATEVSDLYKSLESAQIKENKEALREWIIKWSELESVLAEVSSRRYVAMTMNTKDEKAASDYASFIENIDPIMNECSDILRKKMMAHSSVSDLESEFGIWFKSVRIALDLFKTENIPLETAVHQEVQAYQKITGAMSVDYEGKTYTLPQMAPFLESPNRNLRQKTWELTSERRLLDKESLDLSFDKLFKLRMQISKNTGSSDYLDYIFKTKGRFDYTPKDCRDFHSSIEKIILPALREIYKKRKEDLGVSTLRPWDLQCDPKSLKPLKPFENGKDLIQKCNLFFKKLHPKTAEWFQIMVDQNLIDPDSRLGKAPGGYQIGFDESRLPFIFMNAAGTDRDMYTLFHEGGHSFHQFAMADQPIIAYRDIPSEFAEVASMSMELIATSDLSAFYSKEDAKRSIFGQLEDVIWLFPWVASIDSFQHELYSRPNHTAEDRKNIWLSIMDRFDSGVDYSGYDDVKAYLWQKQLHLFEVPFYYIEYGIAQLGALQVWANFKKDPEKALDQLFKAESLGNSVSLPELFKQAGIRFDFSPSTIEPLIENVLENL